MRQSLLGQVVTSVACARCSGTGEMIPNPCADCRGEGRRMQESTFTVEVPAGVEEGSTLRLADRGAAGQRGGPSGSLFVHLVINPDPRFERQADNLHTTLTISVAQAALGTETDVETLDGPQHLTIGPGPSTGTSSGSAASACPTCAAGAAVTSTSTCWWRRRPISPPSRTSSCGSSPRHAARQVAAPGTGGGEGVFSRLRSAFG